jgi:hypothetical protein
MFSHHDKVYVTQAVTAVAGGHRSPAYTSTLHAASVIMQTEGPLAFWKGNAANVVRVFPYAAAQMAMNDLLKRQFMSLVRFGGSQWILASESHACRCRILTFFVFSMYLDSAVLLVCQL